MNLRHAAAFRFIYFKGEYDRAWGDVHEAQSLGYQIKPLFLRLLREASGRQR